MLEKVLGVNEGHTFGSLGLAKAFRHSNHDWAWSWPQATLFRTCNCSVVVCESSTSKPVVVKTRPGLPEAAILERSNIWPSCGLDGLPNKRPLIYYSLRRDTSSEMQINEAIILLVHQVYTWSSLSVFSSKSHGERKEFSKASLRDTMATLY